MKTKALQRLSQNFPWPETKPDVAGDLHGWFCDSNKTMLNRLLNTETSLVVEVGSWLGMSAHYILTHAPKANVICIDHWRGSCEHMNSDDPEIQRRIPVLYETFLVNLWEYRERVIPLRSSSLEGLKLVHQCGLLPDLIYIDASHEYPDVYQDVKTALELFPASIICGDDWTWDGVRTAVTRIAQEQGKTVDADDTAWHIYDLS